MKYRLSNNVEVYSDNNLDDVLFIKRGTGEILEVEVDDDSKSVLEKFKKLKIVDEKDINKFDAFNFLKEYKLITSAKIPTKDDKFRSQSQAYQDMGLESKKVFDTLSNIKLAIIGIGGTGSWLSSQLLGLGFKDLVLIDSDIVEASNLSRQFFFRKQIGVNKVDALKENLESQFDNISIKPIKAKILKSSDLDDLITNVDIVMIAADIPNRDEAAKLIGDWCLERKISHIVCGGYSGHGSSLGMSIIPEVTPCWNCYRKSISNLVPKLANENKLFMKGHRNTSGLITGVQIGAALSAMEALKMSMKLKPSLAGQYSDFLLSEVELQKTNISKDKDCKWCNV